jgi:hypothetical protein
MSEYTVLFGTFNIPLPKSYVDGDHRVFVTATSQHYLVTVHYDLDTVNQLYQKKDIHKLNLVELKNNNIVWDSSEELEVTDNVLHTPPDWRQQVTIDPNQNISISQVDDCFQQEINTRLLTNFANTIVQEVDVSADIWEFDPESKAKTVDTKITDLLLTAPKNIAQVVDFDINKKTLTKVENECSIKDETITLGELPGGMELTEQDIPSYAVKSFLILYQ